MPKHTTSLPKVEVAPDPKSEKRTRRVFTREYKLSILQQAVACQHVVGCSTAPRETVFQSIVTVAPGV